MQTAIILTGHARTLARTAKNQWWHCWRHFPEPVFFASLVDDEDARSAEASLTQFGARVFIERIRQPDPEIPPGEPWQHAPYAIASSPAGILKQIWHLYRGWKFALLHGADGARVYVRCRPDLWWHTSAAEAAMPEDEGSVIVPQWGGFGGINDRFAAAGSRAAEAYFTAWLRIPDMLAQGCPLHPETIMREAVSGFSIHRSALWFSTLRTSGELRWPEVLPHER